MTQKRRTGQLNVKSSTFICEGERNDYMLHYDQVFVKGEQVIILQMDQQLKTKQISGVSGQLFCFQCKDKFLFEID